MVVRLLGSGTNRMLAALGVRVVRRPRGTNSTTDLTSWDVQFLRWANEARDKGIDANDIGDEEWGTDLLTRGLAEFYLPHVTPASTVLELGPGSGRLTRHLVNAAGAVVAVDKSVVVCDWIRDYLPSVAVHRITTAAVPMVRDQSVDAVFAHGVMEHLDLDELYWFMRDFARVLRPGGVIVFNFNTPTTDGGIAHLTTTSTSLNRSIFRFHAPAAIEAVVRAVGCTSEINTWEQRIAFATITARAPHDSGSTT